jgi:hypothetical protein
VSTFISDEGRAYDFNAYAVSEDQAARNNKAYKPFPGIPLKTFVNNQPVLFAVNGHQGNYWLDNTLVIRDGKLVVKTAPGIAEGSVPALEGPYAFFVANGPKTGIVDVRLADSRPLEDIAAIRVALTGPVLLRDGIDVSAAIGKRMPPLKHNDVTWDPSDRKMAFSFVGNNKKGHLVFVSMLGNPDRGEAALKEIVEIAQYLHLRDAILLGTSADVQQYVAGHSMIMSQPSQGGDTKSVSNEGRPLANILYVADKVKRSGLKIFGRTLRVILLLVMLNFTPALVVHALAQRIVPSTATTYLAEDNNAFTRRDLKDLLGRMGYSGADRSGLVKGFNRLSREVNLVDLVHHRLHIVFAQHRAFLINYHSVCWATPTLI